MVVTPVLFLHGLESNPNGNKARWLASRYLGFAPALTTRQLEVALEEARSAIRDRAPAVVVGSSFGGALLLALVSAGDWRGPSVFVAQAGIKIGTGDRLPEGSRAILVHGTADDVVPFEGSATLAASIASGADLWPVDGGDHRLDVILTDGTLGRAVDTLLSELCDPARGGTRSETVAAGFAAGKHAAQRYGEAPYVTHLAAVRSALGDALESAPETAREALVIAAWLHDVVEDTDVAASEIEARFGADVGRLVWAVTGEGTSRNERTSSAYAKIRATPDAAFLKLADRIANVEASADRPDKRAMYRAEHAAFAEALRSLGSPALWARLERALAG